MIPLRLTIWLIILAAFLPAFAQNYYVDQYRAADGLNTDMIKAVMQDKEGFIWIGTDDGLFKFNGIDFISYAAATSSPYIKDMIYDQDSSILVFHDLGVIRIKDGSDSSRFEVVKDGATSITDSLLWYPKEGFIDNRGGLWISEAQSLVRLQGKRMRRFVFDGDDFSSSFTHSFNVQQMDEDHLIISSYTGNLYQYDLIEDRLKTLYKSSGETNFKDLKKVNGRFFSGTSDGLKEIKMDAFGKISIVDVISDINISAIESIDDQLYLSGNSSDFTIYDLVEGKLTPIPGTQFNSYDVFVSEDKSIWIPSEKGLLVLSELPFEKKNIDNVDYYIEGVIKDEVTGEIYVISKDFVWYGESNSTDLDEIYFDQDAYFLSGYAKNGNLWVSNKDQIWHFKDTKLIKKIDNSAYGRFIFEIHPGNNNDILYSQEGDAGIKSLDMETYKVSVWPGFRALDINVTAIQRVDSGVFVGTGQADSYLKFIDESDQEIVNLALRLPEEVKNGFAVSDIEVGENQIWLGTSKGVFSQTSDSISKLTYNDEIENYYARSIYLEEEYLWFGNALGLFRYHFSTGDYDLFNEKTGLSVNNVGEEGISVSDDYVWVGTSLGVSAMDYAHNSYDKTVSPLFIEMISNGKPKNFRNQNDLKVDYESFIEFRYASMSFPQNKIYYSYRIPEVDSTWSVPRQQGFAAISDLKNGRYTFEVRAKRLGLHSWSSPSRLGFTVKQSFYQTPIFIVIVIIVLLLLVICTRFVTLYLANKRQRTLERLVEKRTRELNDYKNNLEDIVEERTFELKNAMMKLQDTQNQLIQAEKMASLGTLTAGVAHEINNPLNYIRAGLYSIESILEDIDSFESKTELEKLMREVTTNMEFGVNRIIDIVNSLSRFSRGSKNEKTLCVVSDIIENCIMILEHKIKYKVQVSRDYATSNPEIIGNEGNLHQLFINIISNALDSLQENGEIDITILDKDDHVEVQITDNGEGIEEEDLNRLFDPFFTTKAPGVGTGLGLFITHKIVQDHNGEIKFSSRKGVGTEVFIKLKKEISTQLHGNQENIVR